MSGWTPVTEWACEQPMRCDVCGDVLVGRELGYLPIMCERDRCPGPPDRATVIVRPARKAQAA